VISKKIYLPILLIKLGSIKTLVKAMDNEREGFANLKHEFPQVSETMKKEGIFFGPQIEELFEDQDFSTKLNYTERRAWKEFGKLCRNFLGYKIREHYSETVQELITSYSAAGCNIIETSFPAFPFRYFS
jgi:hypothetical protein